MKTIIKTTAALFILLVFSLSLVSCNDEKVVFVNAKDNGANLSDKSDNTNSSSNDNIKNETPNSTTNYDYFSDSNPSILNDIWNSNRLYIGMSRSNFKSSVALEFSFDSGEESQLFYNLPKGFDSISGYVNYSFDTNGKLVDANATFTELSSSQKQTLINNLMKECSNAYGSYETKTYSDNSTKSYVWNYSSTKLELIVWGGANQSLGVTLQIAEKVQ